MDPDAIRDALPEIGGYLARDRETAGLLTQKEAGLMQVVPGKATTPLSFDFVFWEAAGGEHSVPAAAWLAPLLVFLLPGAPPPFILFAISAPHHRRSTTCLCPAKELLTWEALRQGRSVLIDGSLRNAAWYRGFVERVRAGHPEASVALLHVTAPEEAVLARASQRAEATGRVVPTQVRERKARREKRRKKRREMLLREGNGRREASESDERGFHRDGPTI